MTGKKIIGLSLIMLTGCMTLVRAPRTGIEQALQHGFNWHETAVNGYVVTALERTYNTKAPWHVYIEGDGHAWINRMTPSPDPTPMRPVALELAMQDTEANVLYLARPCQYALAKSPACQPKDWTHERFSPRLIHVMHAVLSGRLDTEHDPHVTLIGFSGGAFLAMALAEKRQDVVALITVAGNLEPNTVNRYHKVDLMAEVESHASDHSRLSQLPQLHLVGGRDQVIPASLARQMVLNLGRCATMREYPENSHLEGWVDDWVSVLRLSIDCAAPRVN